MSVSLADSQWVKTLAREIGFDLVGIAPAAPSLRADYIRQWIASGLAGNMLWLNRHLDAKCDVRAYMPSAKSVICVAANYRFPLQQIHDDQAAARVARYALGDDYHEVFKPRLHRLADAIRQRFPDVETRCCVDSSPVLEREMAASAGIGWIGKNTCVIRPGVGSWLLLGEVLVSKELPPDEPAKDHCGTCTRCIEACPTQAITAPYQMDPRKCISYLTIEHRQPLTAEQSAASSGWIFGCDICQEVCPHNQRGPEGTMVELRPRETLGRGAVDLQRVAEMSEEEFRQQFRGNPIRRVKLPLLQANARTLAEARQAPTTREPR